MLIGADLDCRREAIEIGYAVPGVVPRIAGTIHGLGYDCEDQRAPERAQLVPLQLREGSALAPELLRPQQRPLLDSIALCLESRLL